MIKKQLYAAYKRLTSTLRKYIGSELKDGKRYHMQAETKRKQEDIIVISHKTEFKPNMISREKMAII